MLIHEKGGDMVNVPLKKKKKKKQNMLYDALTELVLELE